MKLILFISSIFCALIISAADSDSNRIKVHCEVQGKSFYMGEPFALTVLIDGTTIVSPPQLRKTEDFSFKLIDSNALIAKDKKGFSITYLAVPAKAGKLTIPPITIQADQTKVTTKPITVNVKAPESTDELKLTIEILPQKCYVGQPVEMVFTWYSAFPFYSFRGVNIDVPLLHNPAFRISAPPSAVKPGTPHSIGLPISNTRIIAKRGNAVVNKKREEFLRFKRILTPVKTGTLILQPASLLVSYLPPKQIQLHPSGRRRRPYRPQYPSYFNNNFFEDVGDKPYRRFYIKSEPQTLEVVPLPEKGKPADFYGLVGKIELEVTASPQKVHVGDPVTLSIKVKSQYPSTVTLPDFSESKAFQSGFSVPERQTSGNVIPGAVVFSRIIRPSRVSVTEIPPVRIPYFDPVSGKYGVASSNPIPITVLPVETVTTFDAELSGGERLTNTVEASPKGIRHNIYSEKEAFSDNAFTLKTLFTAATLLPPLLFLLFYMLTANMRLQKDNPAAARAKFAKKRFFSAVSQLAPSGEEQTYLNNLDTVFRTYFAEKLNIRPHSHTLEELVKLLSTKIRDEALLKKITEIYTACDVNRYKDASQKNSAEELKKSAVECVKKIERKI